MKLDLTIEGLTYFARNNGFDKVIFRNRKTNQGDFCIFLYNKKIKPKGYCVGYDGYYDTEFANLSLENCIRQAYQYIIDYNSID